ncbi:MAG: inovirus Gp2 family protein [Alcanivoracaceae bacterium]|nr:inovirus Gp2 family protein [Alcanivoracaceae bacterium]
MKKRHPDNTNITLHYDATWEGLPVLARPDRALAVNYLGPTRSVLDRALAEHPRTCVIHFVARLPYGWRGPSGGLANRFIRSLRSQIRFDLQRKRRQGRRVHDCRVRHIWCREFGVEGQPHYHMAILVNRDAYSALGRIAGQPEPDYPWWLEEEEVVANMAGRIQRAWCSALGITALEGAGLVHFPQKAVQLIARGSPMFTEQYARVFRRLSYMAKVETKLYDDGRRNFGYTHG